MVLTPDTKPNYREQVDIAKCEHFLDYLFTSGMLQDVAYGVTILKLFFSYLGFLSRRFTNHRTAGEGGGHFFNSSIPLPPVSQTLRHQLGDYCRELTFAHSQQPDSNWEPLVSECKSLTTKPSTMNHKSWYHMFVTKANNP